MAASHRELLEPAEEVLDEMPPFVHLLIDGERLCAPRMLGDGVRSDEEMYKWRHLIENSLSLPKKFSMRCRHLYISSSMARGFARRGCWEMTTLAPRASSSAIMEFLS